MNDETEALRVWLQLLATTGGLKKAVDTGLRSEFGVSISRFDILSALDRADATGLNAGELSQRLRVTEGNTTQVTAPLIKSGHVTRTPLPADRRVAMFKLTPKGKRLFAQMAEEHRHWIAEAFSDLSENQIQSLKRALSKIKVPTVPANDERSVA